MEDYLEMICRLSGQEDSLRMGELARHLNVKPSSASKMVAHLKSEGHVEFEKYGRIRLTEKGREAGDYLLYRHEVLHRFLCFLNQSDNEVTQVEQIEHFLNETTIYHLARFLEEKGLL